MSAANRVGIGSAAEKYASARRSIRASRPGRRNRLSVRHRDRAGDPGRDRLDPPALDNESKPSAQSVGFPRSRQEKIREDDGRRGADPLWRAPPGKTPALRKRLSQPQIRRRERSALMRRVRDWSSPRQHWQPRRPCGFRLIARSTREHVAFLHRSVERNARRDQKREALKPGEWRTPRL